MLYVCCFIKIGDAEMKKKKVGKHCIRLPNPGALTKKTETTTIAGVKSSCSVALCRGT